MRIKFSDSPHSDPVDIETLREAGYFLDLPVRVSKYGHLCDEACSRVLEDAKKHLSQDMPQSMFEAPPSVGPVGNLFAYCTPNGLPERIGAHTYLGEAIIILDDVGEVSTGDTKHLHYNMLEPSLESPPPGEARMSTKEHGFREILSEGILQLIAIDEPAGIAVLDANRNWSKEICHEFDGKDLEQFIAFPMIDIGIGPFWATNRLAMGIVLSEAELQMSDHIRLTANKVSLLSQDYWSWEKEYLDWKHNGTRMLNVVKFLSKTDGITFGAAKEKVKAKIIEAQEEFYEQIGRFFTVNPSVSDALRSDIESMGLTLGGFNYWAMFSPRYQDWKKNPLLAADIAASMTETAQVHTSLQGSQIDSSQEQSQPCGDNIEVSKAIKPRGEGENDCSKRMCRSCDTEEEVDMWRKPSEAAIRAPSNFIFSSPSKGTRSGLIGAFNTWIGASADSTTTLTDIIRILHDASLLIDDVQDDSKMRRGNPAAHTIFGMPQTVNSGLFMFTEAVEEARRFKNELSMDILLDTLQRLYLGQSWDLYWKHNLRCPSKEEYLHMVDNKTGSMFRMIARLLQAESEAGSDFESSSEVNFDKLTLLFGRFFQIRDDYMNLKSAKYSDQKGFCEDFDEGKYSFPIVHLLCHHPQYRDYVTGIFRQLPVGISQGPRLSYEMKVKLRDILHDTGTLRDTFALVQKLAKDLQEEISKLEDITGKRNATLRLLVIDLSVKRTDD